MKPSDTLMKETQPARAAYNRGLDQARAGAWEASAAALEQALAADPQHIKARVVLGKVYLRQGYIERAQACWRQVLRIDPGNATARQCLQALAARRMGGADPVRSEDLFRVAVLVLGLLALLLLFNIKQEVQETRRAVAEQSRILRNEGPAWPPKEPANASPRVHSPAMGPLNSSLPNTPAEKGPSP